MISFGDKKSWLSNGPPRWISRSPGRFIGRLRRPGDPPGGGALPLWESVGMRRGFAPHFSAFLPPKIWPCLPFYLDLVGSHFKSPPFSVCRRSYCPRNWVNLSFYSDLVGSHFELRAAHPYWFWPGVPPPGRPVILHTNLMIESVVKTFHKDSADLKFLETGDDCSVS